MPQLTKEQVIEAAFQLTPEERQEVAGLIAEPLELTEEEKTEYRRRIESYYQDKSWAIGRDELFNHLKSLA